MQKFADNIYVLIITGISGSFLLVVSFIIIQIRNQNRLFMQKKKLDEAEIAHQKELLQTVIESQEAERKRIGQDLHDDVGTALSNLRITIEMFNQDEKISADNFRGKSKGIIDKVIQDVRNISHNLSPPGIELYGFLGALEELCESIEESGAFTININNRAGDLPDMLNQQKALSLYRVMQELLNNTIKHARAENVIIDFEVEGDDMLIGYSDDGIGMPVEEKMKRGMGISNIESRLGIIDALFSIDASTDKGFKINIRVKNIVTN